MGGVHDNRGCCNLVFSGRLRQRHGRLGDDLVEKVANVTTYVVVFGLQTVERGM